jgi:hypothetical protein
MENKREINRPTFLVDIDDGPHSKTMAWPLTTRPSGAVGAEGAGTGLSAGGSRGRGAPDRAGPPPPMRGRLCRAVWGEGGRSKPGSVAVWTGARLFFCVHGRTSCHADRGHRQHGPFCNLYPLRRRGQRWTSICLGLFPIALEHSLAG